MPVSFLNFLDITTYANAAALTAVDTTSLSNGMYAAVTDLGVFQLQKQSTSTVNGSTIIAGDQAATTWNVNYNMHLLCSDTSEIDGSQVGSFSSVALADGTAAAPSLTFTLDQDTGIYNAAANTIGFSGAGAMTATLSATALVLNTGVQISAPSGTAAAPAYTFTGDLDVGMYRIGANSLGFAVNGLIAANFSTTQLNLASGFALAVATVQVVGARNTGWTTSSGTGTKNQAALNVDTITATDANLRLLGQWLKGVTDALITHGLLGA